jgi:hypothetical protein
MHDFLYLVAFSLANQFITVIFFARQPACLAVFLLASLPIYLPFCSPACLSTVAVFKLASLPI